MHIYTHTHTDAYIHTVQKVAVEKERGMPACPLTVSWVCGQPKTDKESEKREEGVRWGGGGGVEVKEGELGEGAAGEDRDYESIVLMKLRQAEERKRLNEELANSNTDT